MARRDWAIDIGFDIDDVLYPWYDTAHALCERAGITNGVTPVTWSPYLEYGCDRQAWLDVLSHGAIDGTLYTALPYEGVREQIGRVASHLDVRIRLITARGAFQHGDLIKDRTRWWLESRQISYDTLTFSRDKTNPRTHFFIDDNLGNYDALDARGTKVYLLNRPWNQVPEGDRRRRVNSVKEYVDAIVAGDEQEVQHV